MQWWTRRKKIVMRSALFGMVALISGALSGCASSCDEDDLQVKMTEIEQRVQDMVSSGNLSKMMQVSGKIQKIVAAAPDGEQDLQAACDMADEILNELK